MEHSETNTRIINKHGEKLRIFGQVWKEHANAEHIVKCVNEHEALKQQVTELVEAVKHLDDIERNMTMRSFNPIERAFKTGDVARGLVKELSHSQECVDDVFSDYHNEGAAHQSICEKLLAKHKTTENRDEKIKN